MGGGYRWLRLVRCGSLRRLRRLVVYRVFFGCLVFSVCVAIYFECGGCGKLCPNGGREKSAERQAHAVAARTCRRPNCIDKFPVYAKRMVSRRRPSLIVVDDRTCTTQHTQDALLIFRTAILSDTQ